MDRNHTDIYFTRYSVRTYNFLLLSLLCVVICERNKKKTGTGYRLQNVVVICVQIKIMSDWRGESPSYALLSVPSPGV